MHPERPFQVVDDEGRSKGRYWAKADARYAASALTRATGRQHYVLEKREDALADGFWTAERLRTWRNLTDLEPA